MAAQKDSANTRFLDRFVIFLDLLAIIVGLIGLAGWVLGVEILKTVLPGAVAIKANTAICLVLLGVSLGLQKRQQSRPITTRIASTLAAMVCAVGLLSFLEYLGGWNFGIDQLLFTETAAEAVGSIRPGLMSPLTALDFMMLGSALFLLDWTTQHRESPSQFLGIGAGFVALLGLPHFILKSHPLDSHIALQTVIALCLLSCAVVCSRPEHGFVGKLLSLGFGRGARGRWRAALLNGQAWRWPLRYGMAIGLVLLATVLRYFHGAHLPEGLTYITYFPAVMAVAVLGGVGPGTLATVLSGLCADYFFLDPKGQFGNKDLAALVGLGLFTLTGLGTSWLAGAMDRMRRQSAEEMHRVAAIVNASGDAIIGKTLEGIVTTWNPGAETIYGYTAEDMIGRPITVTIPADRVEEFATLIRRVAQGEHIRQFETLRIRKNGEAFYVSLSLSPLKDDAGKIVGASTIARDITERKRAEEDLHLSQERLALAQKAGHSGTFDWDIQKNINVWTPEVEELHGLAPGEFGGKYEDWEALVLPEDLPPAKRGIRDAIKTGEFAGEWRIRRRNDGEIRWILARAKVLFDADGKASRMLGVNVDVTERKQAEDQVRKLNSELEHRVMQRTAELEAANKELEAFTYSVSHDLRAPLRHIVGFSKILTEDFSSSLPPDAQHLVQRIEEGTRRMGLLVDDLLNLARVGRRDLSLQVTGLRSLVDEVIAALKLDIGDRHVEWKIGDLPYVDCDPALMKQVFQNLLSNAVKFTRPREHTIIEVGQAEHDGTSAVYVRDNGVGFSMKYADQLFGVFQRLHRVEDFEGTGVGLATVQRIIQKHGGRIWAEAELDKGATFYFTLADSGKTELKTKTVKAGE